MNRYDCIMRKKPLIETNPYLRDPERRSKGLIMSVASSTAIETGAKVETIAQKLAREPTVQPLRARRRSAR